MWSLHAAGTLSHLVAYSFDGQRTPRYARRCEESESGSGRIANLGRTCSLTSFAARDLPGSNPRVRFDERTPHYRSSLRFVRSGSGRIRSRPAALSSLDRRSPHRRMLQLGMPSPNVDRDPARLSGDQQWRAHSHPKKQSNGISTNAKPTSPTRPYTITNQIWGSSPTGVNTNPTLVTSATSTSSTSPTSRCTNGTKLK